ncbi:hypothetical protein SLE2022_147620 [Rubroshorea leprosula]
MAAFVSNSSCSLSSPLAAIPRPKGPILHQKCLSLMNLTKSFSTAISCSMAQPETLQIVQSTIAKQLSIEVSSVAPEIKFADMGGDSLHTVEIMMALEEQFGMSIGGGAENIATVQDAADLIEKVKAAEA